MNAAEFLLGQAALARHADRTALVCGEHSLTYGALAAEVARASNALRSLGVAPGDRILLLLRDSPEFAGAWLGAVHAGAVAIGLNTKLKEVDYRSMVEDSAARLVIADDALTPAMGALASELAQSRRLVSARSWAERVAQAGPQAQPHPARDEDPAFWLFSSGTTGRPKAIVHTHRNVRPSGQAQREVFGLGPEDRIFTTSKLFFAYALENGLLGPLALGATAILHPEWADVQAMRAIIERHRPTAIFSVPTFYRHLLGLPAELLPPFGEVRHYVAAGERLPVALFEAWRNTTGREIHSLYGMSETYCAAIVAGKPLSGVEARLLAADGEEVALGETGVLWIRHPALSPGYANRPEATREQFRDGWFCTRDLFVCDERGFYSHQGRSDELVKVAGQWVQPGELEEAVSALEAIAEAACVAAPDADGFERLALFVAARGTDAEAAVAAAERACAEKLPRHKRPKWVLPVEALPRTATGKVQRFKLRELLAQRRTAKD
jgi:acyl-coenzyme A synthetase/AMP-(fatty) acid ligase